MERRTIMTFCSLVRRGAAIRLLTALLFVGVVGIVIACGDDDDDGTATPAAGADPVADPEADPVASAGDVTTRVEVSLVEWAVVPDAESVEAGTIGFLAANDGTEVHELVVLRDGEEIAEIEDIRPGDAVLLPVALEPGTYELACKIRETEANGEVEDHYENGMHAELEVS